MYRFGDLRHFLHIDHWEEAVCPARFRDASPCKGDGKRIFASHHNEFFAYDGINLHKILDKYISLSCLEEMASYINWNPKVF